MTTEKTFVWDLPTRLFHWSLATSFVVTFVTQESEHWRNIHVMAGYVMAGLIAFRLLWGFIGSQHSRFADFWPTLENLKTYLGSLLTRHPKHYVGHNPAGALAIFALLGLGVAASGSGWLTYQDIGGHFMEELHEVTANGMLVVVGIHVLGVIVTSKMHGENLVRAMITGWKSQP